MLIIRQYGNAWYIISSEYPAGHWYAYAENEVAHRVVQWMTGLKFDYGAILSRLYAGTLTEDDRKIVKGLNYCAFHPSRIIDKRQSEYQRIYKAKRDQKG